jgi:putative transposase
LIRTGGGTEGSNINSLTRPPGRGIAFRASCLADRASAPAASASAVLNRGGRRATLFHKPAEYDAFERVLAEALERWPGVRLPAYCMMTDHWHRLLLPSAHGEPSAALRRLTDAHTRRYHANYHTAGTGHVYQRSGRGGCPADGRFKSFAAEPDDACFLRAARYVERNALRAKLAGRAEDWRWGSLGRRAAGASSPCLMPWSDCPVGRPARWTEYVNRPQGAAEEAAIVESIKRGRPYGDAAWQQAVAARLGIESALRPRGRPRVRRIKDSRPL